MAFHYSTPGRYNLLPLLLTFLLCLGAYSIVALDAPLGVTDVRTANVTENSFIVSWTPPSDGNITGYTVIISNGTNKQYDTNETTYTATDLLPGIPYEIIIEVSYGNGSKSNSTVYGETTLPSSVSDCQVADVWENAMNLTWTIPTDVNAKTYKYNIFKQPGDNNVSSNRHFELVSGLWPDTNYNFTIYTETQNGVRSRNFCHITRTTLPSTVEGLMVTSVSNHSVTLKWMFSDPNNKSYTYTVDFGGSNNKTDINETTTEVKNLTAGTNYSFTVFAVTLNGIYSKPSNVVDTTTLPSPVEGLVATPESDNSVTLKWMFSSDRNNNSYTYTVNNGSEDIADTKEDFLEIKGLRAGTNYNYTVFAVTSNGVSSKPSEVVNVTTLPSPVKGLMVISVSSNSVTLGWMFSSDPNSKFYTYTVYGGEPTGNKITDLKDNFTEIRNLTAGMNYSFTVCAVTLNEVYSMASNVTNATTKPNIVEGLKVLSVSENTVTLQWDLSQDYNRDTYTYTVDVHGKNFSRVQNIKNNSVVVKDLRPGLDYNFTLFAVTANEISSQSSKAVYTTTKPSIVEGVAVLNVSEAEVTLHWDFSKDINSDTYTYTIYGQGQNVTNITNIKTNSEVIQELLAGEGYNFTVFAVTKNNVFSLSSKQVHTITMPNAPTNLQGNAVNVSEIYINWTAPRDVNEKLYTYMVTWKDMKQSENNAANTTTTDTHFNITNLFPGHFYKITVRSVISNIASVNAEVYTVTKPLPTENLNATEVSSRSVTLRWNMSTVSDSVWSDYRVTIYSNGSERTRNTSETVFVVDGLDPGSIYNFSVESSARYPMPGVTNRVVTVDSITSYSRPSYIQVETDPDAVQNLKCSKVDAYQIKVHFTCPDGKYSTFKVLVNGDPRSENYSCENDGIISNLQPAVNYKISVKTIAITKVNITGIIICETDNTGVIVGSIFGVLLFLLLIALIVFFVLRNRRSKGGSENILNTTFKRRRFHTIPRDRFKQHYENNHADSDFGFAEEYQELSSVGTTQPKRAAELPENRSKNRFTNVLPYDYSRVKLSIMNGISTSDYINANYMPGYNSTKEFIASQGPLPNTTADFWRMVWEHQINTIVMLTNCMENGRVKCEHYWPLDYTPCTYGDITVTVTSETILSEWTTRDFSVKHAIQPGIKYVRHFHFTAWPDHGVPDSTSTVIQFRNLVREHMDQRKSNGPTVVHCSAGVGRTGTLIALDYLIQQIEKEQRLGIYGFVEKMRMNRNLMVQTEAQYIFLNKCMLDLIDQPADENIYENPSGPELLYENVSAIRNLQRENI